MNYKAYLEGLSYFTSWTITDEINYQYNGEGTALIVKYLNGANYKDSKVQPIQIAVYTTDIVATKATLDTFTKEKNNSPFIDGASDYVQQIYSTPMLLTPFDPAGNNYIHQFIITGTLLISSNVSEIKQVKIDNVIYETTTRNLQYNAQPDNQRVSNEYINSTRVTYGNIQFSCQMIHKNNTIANVLRQIKTNQIDIDRSFTIELTYSDNSTETYTMKCTSFSIDSENQSLPILSLSFMR